MKNKCVKCVWYSRESQAFFHFLPSRLGAFAIWHGDHSLPANWSFVWTSVMPNFPHTCHVVSESEGSLYTCRRWAKVQRTAEILWGLWPAKSTTVIYKQDGYRTPQHAFFHITRRLYWEQCLCFDLAFPSITRAIRQESAPHILHSLTD